ncbi:pitrilysin family protein [Dolichospermum circinale CS-534/05]|uniref:M16 family metallopeptidase n=1 Tax=Dolichospermum circinale TaxID=109265 RepID=UPI0023301B4F|nr:pitrilysin family protein [Dolichospermum circinale]MDB9454680.1 pitrilysin family protein [Dolichospermum circinale CS-541/06]MDB9463496.1 pitrilysin family protein [Dolichospermum circinale CS-541/04]MDB9490795.1 pitrilysin family protein [Dolichospermum circinale CS-534/05]MDB9547623.1 pitrilysin family protein [Dolichospermum circinale CS-1031]
MQSINSSPLIHRTVLSNGIVLLVSENQAADIIAGRIFIRAGSCYEPREKAGLAHLLSAVMTKGCDGLSSLEIAEKIESVGASLGTDAATDYFLLSLKTVTADFVDILTLAGQLLRSPTFPENQIELEKRLAIQDIRSQKEQPFHLAFEQLRQVMYANHPYSMSVLGDETTMSSITRADLVEYHQTHFRPDNIVISIAGRIKAEQAEKLITKIFGDWKIPTSIKQPLNLPSIIISPKPCIKPLNTQQSIIILGYLGPSVNNPEYAALKLLSSYLGNGLSSRLFVELREKQGLAYDVSAIYSTRLFPAAFIVYIGTAPENTKIAFQGLRHEVELLCNTELSAAALQTAKNKIIGQYALGKQTNGHIAQIYGWYEILGLGIEFDQQFPELINNVTATEAITSARKYLQAPYLSIVGQEEAIGTVIF